MATEPQAEDLQQHPEPPQRPEPPRRTGARARVPDHEIAEVRTVEFPVAMRGYDRAAVDAYVTRVNRVLAELQITAAPESAIRHALDEVTEETRGILERAHETADEITRRSRSQADDRLQRAEHEATEVRSAADTYADETRTRAQSQVEALQTDIDRIWQERDSLLAGLGSLATQLEQIAAHAAERYHSRPVAQTRQEPPAARVGDDDADADEE
jgi:cell division initiation protein